MTLDRHWDVPERVNFGNLPFVRSAIGKLQPGAGQKATVLEEWDCVALLFDVQQVAALLSLFWPEFVVRDGLVFLKQMNPNGFSTEVLNGLTKVQAQRSANHVYLFDSLSNRDGAEYEIFSFVGDVLAHAWKAKVDLEFPELSVIVNVFDDEYGPALEMWQEM